MNLDGHCTLSMVVRGKQCQNYFENVQVITLLKDSILTYILVNIFRLVGYVQYNLNLIKSNKTLILLQTKTLQLRCLMLWWPPIMLTKLRSSSEHLLFV